MVCQSMEQINEFKSFGGWNRTYKHASQELRCEMRFTVYYPPASGPVPVLMFLSGLTCTNENFIIKAGGQRCASELGIALVSPDTSPRGLGIEGEDDSWDFGSGAGFYLDATVPKWSKYRMYSYITSELPELLRTQAPELDMSRLAISGHSMGGHGAITIGLKHPEMFTSISAFAPISNPCNCPWGVKAFSGYLGEDKESWKHYDAAELLKTYNGKRMPILCDTGTADGFYKEKQLLPEALDVACSANSTGSVELKNRLHDGYDHSYYFIHTFMEEHMRFHATHLGVSM